MRRYIIRKGSIDAIPVDQDGKPIHQQPKQPKKKPQRATKSSKPKPNSSYKR